MLSKSKRSPSKYLNNQNTDVDVACDKKGGDAKFQPIFKYFQENAPDCHKGHVKLQGFWFRMKICENRGPSENEVDVRGERIIRYLNIIVLL